MKKTILSLLAVLMLLSLAACGSKSEPDAAQVDLEAFWTQLSETYEMPAMMDLTDEILDSYYPGLSDIARRQTVIEMPAMTSVVSEYVFIECESASDADAVKTILQKRVDDQASGGAWYPDSVENWGKAQVVSNGAYVAMVAAGDDTADIVAAWNAQFA